MTENAKQFCPERVLTFKKKIEAEGGYLWHRELDNAESLPKVIDELVYVCFKRGLYVRRRGTTLLIQRDRVELGDINSVVVTDTLCMVERRDFRIWNIGGADKVIGFKKILKAKLASLIQH